MQADDGVGFPVRHGGTVDWSPNWSRDGKTLYFVSDRGGSFDLWQQRIRDDGRPVDSPQQLTNGLEMRYAKFSPDGKKLAFSKGRLVGNLWRAPIPLRRTLTTTWTDAQQLTFGQARVGNITLSPDGKWFVYIRKWEGKLHVWVMSVEGGEPQRVMMDPMNQIWPRWSPDGREIAFHSEEAGNRNIWVVPFGGGPARQLTRNVAGDYHPAWSPDGREIAFGSNRSGNWDIWVIPARGGEARQVTFHPADDQRAEWSPDGEWITFTSYRTGKSQRWRVPAEGGRPEPVPESTVRTGVRYFSKGGNIWEVPFEGSAEHQLTDFTGKYGSLGGLQAVDEQYIYFTWNENTGDIWVMDVEENE